MTDGPRLYTCALPPPTPSAPPAEGWLLIFFGSGPDEGALCVTLRAPDEAADDRAIEQGVARYEQCRPRVARRDVVLVHSEARRVWGVRVAAGDTAGDTAGVAAGDTAGDAPPELPRLRALLAGADAFRLAVTVGPDLETEAYSAAFSDGLQLALLTLAGETLDEVHGVRKLVTGGPGK